MKGPIAKCGMDCGSCGSYQANLRTTKDRERLSMLWAKYLGFSLDPAKLRRCAGCQSEKPDAKRYVNCVIRRCALRSGMATCANCTMYPCDELRQRTPGDAWVEAVRKRVGDIPADDYRDCIEPYLGLANLARVHRGVAKSDIREPLPFRVSPKTVALPEGGLPNRAACLALHRLVSGIRAMPADTWAKHLALERHRKDMLRLLWTFGLHGRLRQKPTPHLEITARDFRRERNYTLRAVVEHVYLPLLRGLGAAVKLVVLDPDNWLTRKGAMRDEGWLMRLSFTAKAGGPPALRALRAWCRALERKHRGRALGLFSAADMRVLARKGK